MLVGLGDGPHPHQGPASADLLAQAQVRAPVRVRVDELDGADRPSAVLVARTARGLAVPLRARPRRQPRQVEHVLSSNLARTKDRDVLWGGCFLRHEALTKKEGRSEQRVTRNRPPTATGAHGQHEVGASIDAVVIGRAAINGRVVAAIVGAERARVRIARRASLVRPADKGPRVVLGVHASGRGSCVEHVRKNDVVVQNPRAEVLVEGVCAVEHRAHVRDVADVPGAQVLVEGRGGKKHSFHVRDGARVPPAYVLIERRGTLEHASRCNSVWQNSAHAGHVADIPTADIPIE